MPEFNFAEKHRDQPVKKQPVSPVHSSGSGASWPVSSDHTSPELPDAPDQFTIPTQKTPQRAGTTDRNSSDAASPRTSKSSILHKYPERDFGRLHTSNDDEATDENESDAEVKTTSEAETSIKENTFTVESEKMSASSQNRRNSGYTSILLISAVILLALIAFLWFVNPFPSLKESVTGLFIKKKTEEILSPAPKPKNIAADGELEEHTRLWDYYMQVSSWKELRKADAEAEKYRAAGMNAAVALESKAMRGQRFYRVRLGPYESAQAAYQSAAMHPDLVPSDAFLDSVRLITAKTVAETSHVPGSKEKTHVQAQKKTQRGNDDIDHWRQDFGVVNEPLSGYAVQVSSLRNVDVARLEARKMVEQGYPAFITRVTISNTTWYRVLVGPFNIRSDADKYTKLINVTFGNEAYTVNLSTR